MRLRLAPLFALLLILFCASATPAFAFHLAQAEESPAEEEDGSEEEGSGAEEGEGEEGEGEEGEGEEAATEEAGPPWTYQMARMTLGIVALMALAIGGAYYRFVVVRQRGGA